MDNPASDPAINEAATFTMDGTASLSGTHEGDYDAHHQWDQGLGDSDGNYTDLTGSGNLSTASTNPEVNIAGTSIASITVTGNTAGTYFVRIQTVDHEDSDNTDTSATQEVTVSAVGGAGRRIIMVN